MGDKANRFRERAKTCLNLAKGARHQVDRIMLEDLAAELEAEAKLVDQERAAKDRPAQDDPKR